MRVARGEAVLALGAMKEPRAAEPLITLLTNEDNKVQQQASAALVAIGTPAIHPLIVALSSSDPKLQRRAGTVLNTMGSPAIEALIAAFKDADAATEGRLSSVLIDIGNPAFESLAIAVKDPNPRVRDAAAAILAKAGIVLAEPGIVKFIQSLGPDYVFFTSKTQPIHSLGEITDYNTQFAAGEFSAKTMALRRLLEGTKQAGGPSPSTMSGMTGTGVQFGAQGTMYPLGVTYESESNVTLKGIGEDSLEGLFLKHSEVRLFVTLFRMSGPIESTGGGMRVRFVASGP